MFVAVNTDRSRTAEERQEVELKRRKEERREAHFREDEGRKKGRRGQRRRGKEMRGQYEKERKAEEKGGHIVESRPSFFSVQSVDKSLFVALHAYHFLPPFHPIVQTCPCMI